MALVQCLGYCEFSFRYQMRFRPEVQWWATVNLKAALNFPVWF